MRLYGPPIGTKLLPGLTLSLNYILELRLSVRLAKTFVIFMPTINKAFFVNCGHEKIHTDYGHGTSRVTVNEDGSQFAYH